MFMDIKKTGDVRYRLSRESQQGMNNDVTVYASEILMQKIKNDHTLQQAMNTATLPSIAGDVLVMPDGHEGYGFPIGGVIGFDAENGVVSPGICGFDINCGVRLIKTDLTEKEVGSRITHLSDSLFKNIPGGVGSRLNIGLSSRDLDRIASEGAEYIIGKGFGIPEDIEHTEENGCMSGADFSRVSQMAKSRGFNELGTLGAGNHFLEVQRIGRIFDADVAKAYGLHEGQIVVMVHTGSRGFGHQICSDYLRIFEEYRIRKGIELVDKELCYARVGDKEAEDYLGAMKCAVNFAFTNRQIITNSIRKSFEETFSRSADSMGMEMLYDVAHNIVKLEEHEVDGTRMRLYVHRKGATRAFPKGRAEIPVKYRGVGQPVLIPGSMGTASYVLVGKEGSMRETLGSACHGAGRVMSRHQALREIPADKTFDSLKRKKVEIRIRTRKLVSEEAEWTYKDIDEVVKVVEKAGIAAPVSRNIPVAVVKG